VQLGRQGSAIRYRFFRDIRRCRNRHKRRSVNSAHGSYRAPGVLVALVNMHTGEVIFGGPRLGNVQHDPGGIDHRVHHRIDGRTKSRIPGAKIEQHEIKMVMLAMLLTSAALLLLAACDLFGQLRKSTAWNHPDIRRHNFTQQGPRGFSESLIRLHQRCRQQRQRMAGFNTNTPCTTCCLASECWQDATSRSCRYSRLAGSLACKKRYTMDGAMPTHGVVRTSYSTFVILLVTAITYIPSFSSVLLAEHFQM